MAYVPVKRSDFQDIKRILTVCGSTAHRFGIHKFRGANQLGELILFLIYNIKLDPIEIGAMLETIFEEVMAEHQDWFYSPKYYYVERKGKNPLQIIQAVATQTLTNPSYAVDDIAPMMATNDTMCMMVKILNYYRNGRPKIR